MFVSDDSTQVSSLEVQELDRCDSSASVASRDYTLMLRDMATLTASRLSRPSQGESAASEGTGGVACAAGESVADPFGYGFSNSGTAH